MNLTQTDIDVRLQLLIDDISEFGEKVAKQLMYNLKDSKKNLKKLQLAIVYMEILEDYNPIGTVINGNTVGTDDNCITEDQAQDLFEILSRMFNRCFPAIGATYRDSILGDYSDDYNDDLFI